MKSYLKLSVLALLTALCIGCGSSTGEVAGGAQGGSNGSNSDPTPIPTGTPTPETTNLRVANAFFGSQDLTVIIDGVVINNDLDAFQATGYVELDPGQHQVIVQSGETAQTVETFLDETFTLEEGTSSTLLFAAQVFPAQTVAEDTSSILLLDNVTPAAGQLTGRLVNVLPFPSVATLQNSNFVSLLGPVNEDTAGPYTPIQTQLVVDSSALVGFFTEPDGPGEATLVFNTVEGTSAGLIETLVGLLDTTGLNITVVFAQGALDGNTVALFLLVDDTNNGSTTVVSIETFVRE